MTKTIAFVIGSILVAGIGSAANADPMMDFIKSAHETALKDAREAKAKSKFRPHRLDSLQSKLNRDMKSIEATQKEAAHRAKQAMDAAQKELEAGTRRR